MGIASPRVTARASTGWDVDGIRSFGWCARLVKVDLDPHERNWQAAPPGSVRLCDLGAHD